MKGGVYVLDANVFIEAARRYYAFDLVPTFWEVLANLARNGKIESIDRVRDELLRGKDDLVTWINENFSAAFASTKDDAVIQSYRTIITWMVEQKQYHEAAKHQFAGGADGWLAAYAHCKGRTLVTHEVLNMAARNKLPIPNVCHEFDIRYINTWEMLRELRIRL